jgi:hypothetical protein
VSESSPSVALSVVIPSDKHDQATYILRTISGSRLAASANVSDKTIRSSSLFSDAFSMANRNETIRNAVELSLTVEGIGLAFRASPCLWSETTHGISTMDSNDGMVLLWLPYICRVSAHKARLLASVGAPVYRAMYKGNAAPVTNGLDGVSASVNLRRSDKSL